MKLFDSHCHFETKDSAEIVGILQRAKSARVATLVAVGGSAALNANALLAADIARSNPETCPEVLVALGRDRDCVAGRDAHPCSHRLRGSLRSGDTCRVRDWDDGRDPSRGRQPDAAEGRALPSHIVARGEIGLDYHYSPETRDAQMNLFAAELEIARAANRPVIIHTREADDDTFALLREIPSRGVIHCYTGSPEAARRFLDMGFYISISGIVTFKNAANVRAAAQVVPDDRLLIETDAPFLAPIPMRGKPNEPAFVTHTCAFLARERGVSVEELAALTYRNADNLFSRA